MAWSSNPGLGAIPGSTGKPSLMALPPCTAFLHVIELCRKYPMPTSTKTIPKNRPTASPAIAPPDKAAAPCGFLVMIVVVLIPEVDEVSGAVVAGILIWIGNAST